MACTEDFIQYVQDQIGDLGEFRARKMFGDWCIYLNDKPIMLCCDNVAFVKMVAGVGELMANADRRPPYDGAKDHYVLDLDNRSLVRDVVRILEAVTPLPKRKKKC